MTVETKTILKTGEKLNMCGVVTERYCKNRCRPPTDLPYPKCDTPPETRMIADAENWIKERCFSRKSWNPDWNSYNFKHIMEDETSIYVTNGAFIQAAINLGYKIRLTYEPNVSINIGIKSNHNRRFWTNKNIG